MKMSGIKLAKYDMDSGYVYAMLTNGNVVLIVTATQN